MTALREASIRATPYRCPAASRIRSREKAPRGPLRVMLGSTVANKEVAVTTGRWRPGGSAC